MATSALIVLDDEALPTRVLGVDRLEFIGRQLASAGIRQLVVVVDRVPRHLGDILDRLADGGLRCSLARSTSELAELFHPDEIVVVLTGTTLGDPVLLRELAQASRASLLCVGQAGGVARERIDATTWWTGLGTMTGTLVRRVATAPGEWDVASTILRAAVQAGVERRSVRPGSLVDPADAASVRRFEVMAVRHPRSGRQGWGTSLVADPVARAAGMASASRLAVVGQLAVWASALLSVGAIAAASLANDRRSTLAALCVVGAGMARSLWRLAASATGSANARHDFAARLGPYAATAALLTAAWRASDADVALTLAVALVALTWLVHRSRALVDTSVGWWPDVTGHALVVAGATAISPRFLTVAMCALAVHVFATLIWFQNRVSKLLTNRP